MSVFRKTADVLCVTFRDVTMIVDTYTQNSTPQDIKNYIEQRSLNNYKNESTRDYRNR